jgi:hypothetical protein
MPDRVAAMIGATIPLHVLQAEVDADAAIREVLRYRPLNCDEDRQDFEDALSRLARENKILGKHHPLMLVRGAA